MNEIAALLRTVDPFSHLPADDVRALARRVEILELPAGNPLFTRGEAGDRAYVIVDGQLEVTAPGPWQPIVLATVGRGDLVGEAALLRGTTRNATVTARTDTTLAAIGADDLHAAVGSGAGALMQTILDRWDSARDRVMKAERMAQLGTLAAGIAHELNNPAAAVQRSSQTLTSSLERLDRAAIEMSRHTFDEIELDLIGGVLGSISESPASDLGPLERVEQEEGLGARLEEMGVGQPWSVAADAVAAAIGGEVLDRLAGAFTDEKLSDVFDLVVASATAKRLAGEISWASGHMSEVARDLGEYTRLGEAPVQDVDVVDGLDHTVRLVAHRLEGIDVVRHFDDDLPRIQGAGSELNQVWTNLIANAADAAGPGGTVTLRAFAEEGALVVEVEDDGPGIAPDDIPRIFDAFFTTKPPGSGTGLGLPISHKIIVADHGGELTVESEPGRTVFRVALPAHPVA